MNHQNRYANLIIGALPWLVPVVVFYCVAAVMFAPQFAGKVLPQHDIEQYDGMWRDIRQQREATGEDVQWTGAMFSGMPAYLINVRYPSQLVKNTLGKVVKAVKTPVGFIFFAMLSMWLMTLVFGMSPWVGAVAALAYGLSTYFFLIIGAGHVTKMWALVYAPLMMGGAYATLRRDMIAGGLLTAAAASLEIGANHPQITYYFLIAMAAFWVSELIYALREKHLRDFAKRTAVLIAAGIVAAGSNFAPLWYTSQHSPDTIRGGSEVAGEDTRGLDFDYATAWSYGIAESWNMLIPDFAGGYSGTAFERSGAVGDTLAQYGMRQAATQLPAYWGGQPYTAGPTYLGAAALMLALLGLILARGRDKWWIAAAMGVMLLLSWGRNMPWLTELCFRYLPMYNKFRTVSMTMVVLQWGVPLLAAAALWKLWTTDEAERRRLLKPAAWAAGTVAGICLLMIAAGGSFFDFGYDESEEQMTSLFYYQLAQAGAQEAIAQGLHEELGSQVAAAMVQDRIDIMRADAWRSLIFILLTAGVLVLFALRKCGRAVTTAVAAILVTADLAAVDLRYLPHSRFVEPRMAKVTPTAADRKIMADKDPAYRVYNRTVSAFNDATTSNFHRSIGGYHGAKLARYQDIIDVYLREGRENEQVLDMLNTRYVIVGGDNVQYRSSANGAAWLVGSVTLLPSAADELEALGRIDTKTQAVASAAIKASKNKNSVHDGTYDMQGSIRLAEYKPNRLRYEYESETPSFAVFSEIFYDKGWQAFVDGSDIPAVCGRVDYILRGMELPAGKHTIEWRFKAPAWNLTGAVTLIFSLVILIGGAIFIVCFIIKKYRNERKQKA